MSIAIKPETRDVEVTISRRSGYEFVASVAGAELEPFTIDEDPPLGAGRGPSPAALVAAAVADCLGSSLLFCLSKSRVTLKDLNVTATAKLQRNEKGRLRITDVDVILRPQLPAADKTRFERCEELFEDFCTVTQSVRRGIAVNVEVRPLYRSDAGQADGR